LDVEAYLTERSSLVNRYLEEVVPPGDERPADLHAAMRHLLFPGGKRLRPALVFAGCHAAGGPTERALPAAAAVELVHTYSLIHDDLPCMDDDDERRGRPTVHVAFGEAVAVLAGDALLALAFEVLASGPGDAEPERRLAALGDLARAADSRGLVGGQADDLTFPADEGDTAAIESVHRRKTAALIAASVVSGARLGGADTGLLEQLRAFGEAVGVAFQIADDLLDWEKEEPCSLARVLGPVGARERAEELLGAALARIEDLGERGEPLRELARFAVRRDR
jgi:geranylgeranyl diphosphate synthase type II